jgi:hypothetical protein
MAATGRNPIAYESKIFSFHKVKLSFTSDGAAYGHRP